MTPVFGMPVALAFGPLNPSCEAVIVGKLNRPVFLVFGCFDEGVLNRVRFSRSAFLIPYPTVLGGLQCLIAEGLHWSSC